MTNTKLTIALISDSLTFECLNEEADVHYITPTNYKRVLSSDINPDFLFVESTWLGISNEWKYKIATSPSKNRHRILDFIMQRNNNTLSSIIKLANSQNLPTVFWNKEDPVHYDRFIASAKLFDYIFTVDEGSITNYNNQTHAIVNTLPFAVQTRLHNPSNKPFPTNGKANFVGSYGNINHVTRKIWQDLFFDKISNIMPLDVYDRNSDRLSSSYRFPTINNMTIYDKVTNAETANIYKNYDLSLNVNTVETSTTMLSRRLVEIIACAGVAITNDSPAVQKYFKDYCYVVKTEDDLLDVLNSIKDGIPQSAKDRALAGAEYIKNHHTWDQRLQFVLDTISSKPRQ